MAVKHVQSAARVLATFEALAEHQPIGVSALSRLLADDKSGVQRALMTLADAGWIERVGDGGQWEVTSRVLGLAQRRSGLRERARATLEALRDETDETIILNVPESGQIVVLDVIESNQLVRTAPHIGLAVPATESAAGQAILAHLPDTEVGPYVDGAPGPRLPARLAEVRRRGWAVNAGDVTPGARAVGAAILDADQWAIASITVSAPADRMPPAVQDAFGPLVAAAARRLSIH
ncbi:MAG: IclR family transcriptional regulator [Acidimicrobiales bacterium]